MQRSKPTQLNIRSSFARERTAMLARETGMTVTQIVEETLRAYLPPPSAQNGNAGLVRKGALLVKPASGKRVSLDEANAALEEARSERD